jgi:SNF2 family DNA or RNA helicase
MAPYFLGPECPDCRGSSRCTKRNLKAFNAGQRDELDMTDMIVRSEYQGFELEVHASLEGQGSSLTLLIRPEGSPTQPVGSVMETPTCRISRRRIENAVQSILEHDAIKVHAIKRWRSVQVNIPLVAGRAIVASSVQTTSECFGQRPPVERLIAPWFLKSATVLHLRPFQRTGCAWLVRRRRAILADDMGLGKTIQAIYSGAKLLMSGQVAAILVLAPNTLLDNWQEEFARYAPRLCTAILRPQPGEQEGVWNCAHRAYHALFMSYEQFRPSATFMGQLSHFLVIADEAHRLRNAGAKVTHAALGLDPAFFWALTGTPIERDEEDLATLLSVLFPDRFKPADAGLPASALRRLAEPFVLRRRKSQVLRELPDVIENVEWLDLTDAQRKAYSRILREARDGDSSAILRRIGRLRAICDLDPATHRSSKIDRAADIILDIAKSGEKVVVFSFSRAPLELLQRLLSEGQSEHLWVERLDGRSGQKARAEALQEFSGEAGAAALLLSGHIGGEGLNLTAANHVIFLNQWWNPSKNIQARDRLVRIGQNKGVVVWYLVCRNTIEEQVQTLLADKTSTFEEIVERLAEALGLHGSRVPLLGSYLKGH